MNKDNQLDALLAGSSKTMEPARDLWPQIEARLDVPAAKKTAHWRSVAIASLLLLGVFVGKSYLSTPQIESTSPLLMTMASIQAQHQQQVAQLQTQARQVNWQTSALGAPLEQGIEQLRAAAKEIYRTLQLNPTDKQLWQLWLWTQEREIELIKQGQRLPVKQTTKGNTV
ncbi:hypothetical protein LZP69_15605 [Shewanella sp. AS1]|uniref:hypothetical protein n=1 Tax=Shewanella sp. AS1 TaxID=2907626 RepID=UPI001F198F6C|nr:hypothetical protein [Shewanella sp. AS1]MCE9680580.1 hypothetical protein [Shewanella sp. AS1]